MSMTKKETFFTSVGCMDGRVQKPIADFGQKKFGAKFPDTITEAGLAGLLSKDNPNQGLIASLKAKINISIQKHSSKGIIVHGHEDCVGNPVNDKRHKQNILEVGEVIASMFPRIAVIPVFVKRKGKVWTVEEL